jgi:hypothetical protein
MRTKLRPGAVILLDDAERPEECAIAMRWAEELRTSFQVHGEEKPYALLTVPGGGF